VSKVLIVDGFTIHIYAVPPEHNPPHVHVLRAGTEVRIKLGSGQTPPDLWMPSTMRRPDEATALGIVEDHIEFLRSGWRRINGNPKENPGGA
jgi:uncharacterized protein DUF4160